MANAVRIDRPKREPTSAELATDNERLKRKVHNQRRELERLRAQPVTMHVTVGDES